MGTTHDLAESRGWLLFWGCVSIIAGMAAIAYSVIATLISVLFVAWLLIIGGALESVYAIQHRERPHLVLYLLEAALAIAIGIMVLLRPVGGAVIFTLLVAAYFVVSGIFRIAGAIALRLLHWGWLLTSGIINLALGVVVWAGWPVTGLWVLGMFVGVNMIFSGLARVMLAPALRAHHWRALPI